MLFSRLCRIIVCTVLAFGLTHAALAAAKKKSGAAEGTYRGFIAMDAATGKVLLEEHSNEVTPPASMTKLMTYAVLSDKLRQETLTLETKVIVDADDSRIGGTQVYLKEKEEFTVEDLIYAMMIQSANDAAHALARTASGSVRVFVDEMNAKARELGMTQTTFRTPHGLPPSDRQAASGDLTTPRDFALLARHLLTKTDVLKYTSVRSWKFGEGKRPSTSVIAMDNHNKLLGKVNGVDGLKTGYTKGAGYCLAATAQRNGRRVIVVIMGAFGPNGEIDKGRSRDLKTIEILERGFASIPPTDPTFVAAASSNGKPASPSPLAPVTPAPGTPASTPVKAPGEPVIRLNLR
ncbi:MAG: D-alanyl-D-alanine carboxypeptidase [Opitutae bacterium]|nr:D-alanyl-D-alanine carboxypeptidase [Opitutae bacterium]